MMWAMRGPLTLGLNQYTHSAAACLLDADGAPLFLGEKERLTRKKHDGGDCAELVEHALAASGAGIEDLGLVVANNHLFRIDRFRQALPWAVAQYSYRESYLSPFDQLPGVPRLELSHHLAHAWSVLPYCPFDRGLIVVMDGMGSTLHEMELPGEGYRSELGLAQGAGFRSFPAGLEAGEGRGAAFGWREAESVYRFDGLHLERAFKRWTPEVTPTLLHNYGFERMESLGAVYSRVASHVFGDWNHCGKVMGLAPWAPEWAPDDARRPVMQGPLEELVIDWERLEQAPHANLWREEETRPASARLAADVQADLEDVVLDFLGRLREETGETRLAFCGGVALNSTLNGRLIREAGFEEVFIPPYPGDQGIAVGCAAYGHLLGAGEEATRPAPRRPLSPYGGRAPEGDAVEEALARFGPWLDEAALGGESLPEVLAEALADGQVVGLCRGRAEFGPRALGHRSILADPREAGMVARINRAIKKREGFRPFAPTVLEAAVPAWFAHDAPSPYMSHTVAVLPEQAPRIPAVVHADGTARLQTLAPGVAPFYEAVITAFAARTEVPMVLNTSFNIRGEPIVETAGDAAWSFLRSELDLLVLEDRLFRRRELPEVLPLDWEVRAVEGWTAETLSDPTGETLGLRLMAYGDTFDLDQLQLGLLEACPEPVPLGELLEAFAADWDVPPETCLEALMALHGQCLVVLGEAP